MTQAKPLLLLDVDGVICPLGPGPGDPMRSVTVGGFPVTFCEELPARLSRLGERFSLVWATSWGHGANDSLATLLGLPQLPLISFPSTPGRPGQTWKLGAVRRFVRDRPMAWVDDELGADAHTWAQRRRAPTLLLDVNPAWGLAAAHVELLLDFAERVAADREVPEGDVRQ